MRTLLVALLFSGSLQAQDVAVKVVVSVRLEGVGEVLVLAEKDSAGLHLPTLPIYKLVGLPAPHEKTLTVSELAQRLRVAIDFISWRQEVVIVDRIALLPATRAMRDKAIAKTIARQSSIASVPGGFGGSVAVDNQGAREVLMSYGWKRASVGLVHNTVSGIGARAGVSFHPLFLSGRWSERSGAQASVRLLLGRSWAALTASEVEEGDLRKVASAGAVVGPVAFFASSIGKAAVTLRLPQLHTTTFQVGYTAETDLITVRATYGRAPPSFNVRQIY